MLAEIRGKLSHDASTPADRLEDTLTDAVFSTLCYLPRNILGAVLRAAFGVRFTAAELDAAGFRFWPRLAGGTEPDVVLTVGGVMIVIEAKYESPFSRQLEREWRHGREDARARRLQGPWLLAVTGHAAEPDELAEARTALASNEVFVSTGLSADVAVRWLPWRRVADAVNDARPQLTSNERALAADLLELMERRGVRHMFEGFAMDDYWLVTSAQRAAAERLYPTLSRLVQELNAAVSEDQLFYCNTSPNAIAHWHSLQFAYPAAWARAYFLAPYWSTSWSPSQPPQDLSAALFVMFNFWTPQIEVGFYLHPAKPSLRPAWTAATPELTASLQSLPQDHRVVTDDGWWTRTAEAREPGEVDEPWVRTIVSRGAHLRFHSSVPTESVRGVGQLRDLLIEARDLVSAKKPMLQLVAGGTSGEEAQLATETDLV